MSEKQFVDGMILKFIGPYGDKGNAPDFVKGKLSIKCAELVQFMRQHQNDGWINVDLKVSKQGRPYAELNSWRKEAAPKQESWGMDEGQKKQYDQAAQGFGSEPPEYGGPTGEDIPF